MFCFRYSTPALHGSWYATEELALRAALRAGQAEEENGSILLRDFVSIEKQDRNLCLAGCEQLDEALAAAA